MKKTMNTNPRRGPVHYRSPARMFWRTVRGMLPHKTTRGAEALARLQCFEGIPHPFDSQKRMVVPKAMRIVRLKPGRKYTNIGVMASQVGWKNADLIKRLEAKRKVKSEAFYQKKKAGNKLKAQATAAADLTAVSAVLDSYGHA
jgi:large subunit ribosomal protein L13Ae